MILTHALYLQLSCLSEPSWDRPSSRAAGPTIPTCRGWGLDLLGRNKKPLYLRSASSMIRADTLIPWPQCIFSAQITEKEMCAFLLHLAAGHFSSSYRKKNRDLNSSITCLLVSYTLPCVLLSVALFIKCKLLKAGTVSLFSDQGKVQGQDCSVI